MQKSNRILILDGAFGTMVPTYGLDDRDFILSQGLPKGCNDVLTLTRPDVVMDIHARYLRAGADIVTTNSFNANAISLADYGLADRAYDIARASAEIAREAVKRSGRDALVAGSMGPTNRTLSMSPDVNAPAYREVDYEQMRQAYRQQAQGLIDGGADVILIETVFDTLNAKAAISGVRDISADVPIIISGTLSDASGRTLSGQTVEAFVMSVLHARPWAVGLNCGYGARHLLPYLRRLERVCPVAVSVHPNAGLPNVNGEYDETPAMFAADMEQYMSQGLVDIAGGCCGTTPEHIAALAEAARRYAPRMAEPKPKHTYLTGLEPLVIDETTGFVNVGERTNVAGSAKFARLIREGNFPEALSIARAQVDAGAQIVDVCMDDAMIDGPRAMSEFLRLMASEPAIARVPVMIDSSRWDTIEAGLQCVQGKSIVNSISLKEGEEAFLARARQVMGYGAAAVVMLFDEQGQADTYERKVQVARRAYDLLTSIGFPAEDIIFDPNILAVATGMPEHDRFARDYIEATRWIKANLPGAKVSGGVSNLSFAFRGNNDVRKAMHAVFLYHAIAAGMDMAIVNPQMVQLYSDIPADLLEAVEDVILYRRPDAAERLTAMAQEIAAKAADLKAGGAPAPTVEQSRQLPLPERISRAMLAGDSAHIAADAVEAAEQTGSAIAVINDMLMPAMEQVGTLFGQGKMFLPQVVKSARVMKLAVDALAPYFPDTEVEARDNGRVVLATVKGDVHDIGKNIVSIVLACNGYRVYDLGVMAEPEAIVAKAAEVGADAIGLSGLITPSLAEMIRVAQEAERQSLGVPIIIGGATTSALHTAVKIAPATSAPVVHATDAADTSRIVGQLRGQGREQYIADVRDEQERLRQDYAKPKAPAAAPVRNPAIRPDAYVNSLTPTLSQVRPRINWRAFYAAWGIAADAEQQAKVRADAERMLDRLEQTGALQLRGVVRTFPARADGDDIVLTLPDGSERRLPMLRSAQGECVADFVRPGCDCCPRPEATLFAISAGFGLKELTDKYMAVDDQYQAIMAKLLADRLTEAYADTVMQGGCRIAFGYPSAPDHSLKADAFDILDVEGKTGMSLTDNYMIVPGEAICGIYLRHGRYIDMGAVSDQAIAEYANRRGIPAERMREILGLS